MKSGNFCRALFVCASLQSVAAVAAPTMLSANGFVTRIYDSHNNEITGSVRVGDAFNFAFSFDPSSASETSNAANSYNYRQYYTPSTYQAQIGSFAYSGASSNYLDFFNNFNACGTGGNCPVDASYLSQVGFGQTSGPYAVNPGQRTIYQGFTNQLYDGSAIALDRVDIGAVSELHNFSNSNLTYTLFNSDTKTSYYIEASGANFGVSQSGPDAPAPLLGMGVVPALGSFGGLIASRLRRRKTVAA